MDMKYWDPHVSPWRSAFVYAMDVWHAHREPTIVTALAVLFVVRLYFLFTGPTVELKVFPRIYNDDRASDGPDSDDTANDDEGRGEEKQRGDGEGETTGTKRVTGKRMKTATRTITGDGKRSKSRRQHAPSAEAESLGNDKGARKIQVLIFYSSITGNTEGATREVAKALQASLASIAAFMHPKVLDLAEVDLDEYFVAPPKLPAVGGGMVDLFYLVLMPSYDIDTTNDTFLEHLKETHHDFRIDNAPLSSVLGYSVFGFGDREGWPTEEEGFCAQARQVDRWMARLTGRRRAYPLGTGDWKADGAAKLEEWREGVAEILVDLKRTGSLGGGVPGSGDADESDDEAEMDDDGDDDSDDGDGEVVPGEGQDHLPRSRTSTSNNLSARLDDVEDLGRMLSESREDDGSESSKPTGPVPVDFTTYAKATTRPQTVTLTSATTTTTTTTTTAAVKEMVPKNSPTYAALTKQGYSIVGSHSGVKICRWTKSALRGRGSCYKFSFYGIASHRCMEATPSLSCSNKCIFCWRHGTNPVGTTWRWAVDAPEAIFDGIKQNHYYKIRMLRGVPGVRADRFAEAMRIRHCALSLVGEPIFYPHINELVALLHAERISTFLVCNAQHPDQLAALGHVTQLYVSIDASNRDSLRRIDRPLHRDFWERFTRCLDILRERRFRRRTVFRLTLVKGFNVEDEAEGYAELVARALPCFVEIKGVTFCGTSTSSSGSSKKAGLTMANVPFYAEVCEFVEALGRALAARGLDYGIAAEHAHSCCVLLASGRFRDAQGRWHSTIDYGRFFALLEEKGPDGDFAPEDYMSADPTPEWAAWGRGGFDPRDQRVDRKGRPVGQIREEAAAGE